MLAMLASLSFRSGSMRPIVAVIGTTGVGKSQLAVHLAKSLEPSTQPGPNEEDDSQVYNRGVVLSADSMQLYKGLDVITNKATLDEMKGVEHWGLDVVQPGQGGSWELGRWYTEAGKVVDKLPQSSLPILCGGTHYFIQHFLFPPPELSTSRSPPPTLEDGKGKSPLKPTSARWTPPHPHPPTPDLDAEMERLLDTFWTISPEWPGEASQNAASASDNTAAQNGAASWSDSQLLSLHRLLAAVDPSEAGRWHWRDGRKVKRGLERWWERGEGVAQDAVRHGAGRSLTTEGPGRKAIFRTLIFWVYEPLETLRPRLDRRVDKMVANGLLREIAELRAVAEAIYGSVDSTDHTEGIFQAIGYKEFSALPLDVPDPTAHPAFSCMLDRMKLSTHQYAKSQLKWIRNQLLPAIREARKGGGEVAVYLVPGGEANEAITAKILDLFLRGRSLPDPKTIGHPDSGQLLGILEEVDKADLVNIASRQTVNARKDCPICSTPSAPYSIMLREWETHVKSKLHKRNKVAVEGGREALIARQKAEGLQLKAERERSRQVKDLAMDVDPP